MEQIVFQRPQKIAYQIWYSRHYRVNKWQCMLVRPFISDISWFLTCSVRKEGLYAPSVDVFPVPLMDFMCETAMRRMVSLSGFLASALQVGTMSDSSVMYRVILLRRRRSISLWFSLEEERNNTAIISMQWELHSSGSSHQPYQKLTIWLSSNWYNKMHFII